MQKPGVTSPIIGARSLSSLNDNLVNYITHTPPHPQILPSLLSTADASLKGASGWTLTAEEMAELDKASAITPPYPYNIPKMPPRNH